MRNNISKLTLSAIVLAVAGLLPAYATETLTLSDNMGDTATGVVVSPGLVVFAGSVGNWNLNLSAGITMPLVGSTTSPAMDLISVNGYNGGGANHAGNVLTITFTETGFGPTAATASAATEISGTQSRGSTSFTTSANGSVLTSSGALTTAPFSSSGSGSLADFSGTLSETVVLTASGSEVVSFDATLSDPSPNTPPATVPDSGMTLVLLGAGLTALGLFARLHKQVEM